MSEYPDWEMAPQPRAGIVQSVGIDVRPFIGEDEIDEASALSKSKVKHPTVLKTFRLPVPVLDELEKEARDEDWSLNSVVLTALTKHAEWDSKTRNLGYCSISKSLLKVLLNAIPDEEIANLGRSAGAQILLDRALFLYQDSSMDSILKVLELAARHQGLFDLKVRRIGKVYNVTVRHDLGPKYSLMVENVYGEVWRKVLKLKPTFIRGDTTLTMLFALGEPLPTLPTSEEDSNFSEYAGHSLDFMADSKREGNGSSG